uniref:F-box domain-containing protein n=1 Tax=Hyaloperonospora arabidopsidis (strain Emoy2) TaxID=559515 RepID=M4B8M4_HYAAE
MQIVSLPSETASSSTWYDPTDVQLRKFMMVRLQSHPALAQHHPILQSTRDSTGTSLSLLQRLEWMLYYCAGSLSEYLHQPSLERRVQGLVTHYKRKRSETESSEDVVESVRAPTAKRQRPQLTITEEVISNNSIQASECVLNSNVDLLRNVYSYLEGMDVLRCRFVSKFLYVQTPSLVRTLHIDAASMSVTARQTYGDGAADGLSTLLHQCKNLTSLTISNQVNQTHIKANVVFPRALTTSTYASYGYQLVCGAAEAFSNGACPLLQELKLVAPFDFATESDAVITVLRALTDSKRERGVIRTPLKHLALDATFLGDRGVQQLADLFETQSVFFVHLETLTVRNNFIGETGCRDLLEAIELFSDLHTLDLSRNILTDTDALTLADLLDNFVIDLSCYDCMESDQKMTSQDGQLSVLGLASLRTLKLQENFITCDGFHAIAIALGAREGFPVPTGSTAADYDDVNSDVEVRNADR